MSPRTRRERGRRRNSGTTLAEHPAPAVPRAPLYAAGARLTAAYPFGPLMEGAGLNITVASYVEPGWTWALALLALGPLFGIFHMARLRQMPEAQKLAGGKR